MTPSSPKPTPGSVVRLPIERKLDRQLDVCRHGAVTDRCTVVIEKRRQDRFGNEIVTPVIEVSPNGDINEVPVPTMRTSMRDLFKSQYLGSLDGSVSESKARAIDRMTVIAAESENEITTLVSAARERAKKDREKRARRAQQRAERRARWDGKRAATTAKKEAA